MNESEAALLSGVPEAQLSSSLDDVAKVFFEKGVQTVIITLGSKVSSCYRGTSLINCLLPMQGRIFQQRIEIKR